MNKTLSTLGSLCSVLPAISACDPNDQSSGGDDELLNRVASLETKAKEQESRDKDLEAKGKDNTGRLSSNEKDVGQLQQSSLNSSPFGRPVRRGPRAGNLPSWMTCASWESIRCSSTSMR